MDAEHSEKKNLRSDSPRRSPYGGYRVFKQMRYVDPFWLINASSGEPRKSLSPRLLSCPVGGVWQAFCVRRAVIDIRLTAAFLAGLALAGCGASQAKSAAPSQTSVAAAFKGSPAPLASLHSQANQLLSGGPRAFHARLSTLRGYPVVVNKWASWCGPCQTEFPAFQKAAVRYGREVAFVGVDGKDGNGSAAAFLKQFPVSYPSYVDPQEDIARTIQAATYYPQTVYFDKQGKPVFDHAGPYTSAAALERDIRRYALG
jgi:cytochrome c biogenesis protein CcmG, thiol:disulfide interchange protein DsbE